MPWHFSRYSLPLPSTWGGARHRVQGLGGLGFRCSATTVNSTWAVLSAQQAACTPIVLLVQQMHRPHRNYVMPATVLCDTNHTGSLAGRLRAQHMRTYLGAAKVGEGDGAACAHEHVLRLEVAVDHFVEVQVVQRLHSTAGWDFLSDDDYIWTGIVHASASKGVIVRLCVCQPVMSCTTARACLNAQSWLYS